MWSRLPVWLAVAMLLGTAVLFRVAEGEGTPVASLAARDPLLSVAERTSSISTQRERHVRENTHGLESESEPVSSYLLPGDDYAAVAARLIPLIDKDDVALFLMSEAAAVCITHVAPGWKNRARNPRGRAYLEWHESFCKTSVVSTADRDAYLSMRRSRLALRHPEWSENSTAGKEGDPDSKAPPLLEAVLDSDSIDELVVAATTLMLPDSNVWSLGQDLVQGTPQASRLNRYQEVAIDALQCEKTGGWGANGLRTAMFCVTSAATSCSPAQSAYDTWSDEFTPPEIDIILAIKQRIAEERSRRAQMRAEAK